MMNIKVSKLLNKSLNKISTFQDRHKLACNFLKVFIEILQSCYNPILRHLPCRTVMRNCKYVLKFTFYLTDLPFLKTLKAQKIESIKGKISLNFAAFCIFFRILTLFFPFPQKSLNTNHTPKLQYRSEGLMVA